MKRKIILLLSAVLLLTGCNTYKFSNNIDENIEYLLSTKSKLHNSHDVGYSYYLPKGISFISKDKYNALLKDMNKNYYYLYVDVISYYHKKENDYVINKDSYYSDRLEFNKKSGYIQIDEAEGKYFIQFVYNYVKVEALVSKKDLVDSINNMCYILRSFKFNNVVIESLVGDNVLDYQEEDYSLFKPDSSKEDYMDIVSRSESEEFNKYLEDEKIDLNY